MKKRAVIRVSERTSPLDPFLLRKQNLGKEGRRTQGFFPPLTPELIFAHSISGSNLKQRRGNLCGRER